MTAPFDLTQTDKLLSTTRAVRRRLDLARPVERDVLLECIGLSQQAPTASNTQTWRWMIVTDADLRAEVARLYTEIAEKVLPAARQLSLDNAQTQRVYDSAEFLGQHLHEVPALVIPCVSSPFGPATDPAGAASLYGSIFPAVWSFQLALRSRGLGSALTTIHLYKAKEVGALLGIPESMIQVALLPVAYTQGTDFKVAQRPPAESIVHWDRWQEED